MDEDQIHVAVSNDGTKIAGRVQGQGPPLVLVHGGLGDGNVSWFFMLPFLVEHFTCYLLSTRGRGLSSDNADHSRERQERARLLRWDELLAFEGIRQMRRVLEVPGAGHSPNCPDTCQVLPRLSASMRSDTVTATRF